MIVLIKDAKKKKMKEDNFTNFIQKKYIHTEFLKKMNDLCQSLTHVTIKKIARLDFSFIKAHDAVVNEIK